MLADKLIDSINKHMPSAIAVQLTDMDSPATRAAEIRRLPSATLSLLRSQHYSLCVGNWLLVDTDVVIERDVSDVFNMDFDVAVTDRIWPHLPKLSDDFVSAMPYCAGVVFSKNAKFWKNVNQQVSNMSIKEQNWLGDQRALAIVIADNQWKHIVLPGAVYQYPPLEDEIGNAAITHWKGTRKQALLQRIHKEWGLIPLEEIA